MLPDTMTLAEARDHILNGDEIDPILGLIKITHTVSVRFLWSQGPHAEKEFPDDMTVGTFRALADRKWAKLVIDDMGGGTKVKPRQPELV